MKTTLFFLLSTSLFAFAGCAASSESGSADDPTNEDDLKASECPLAVDVTVSKPSIAPDAALTTTWAKDMAAYESDPKKAAQDQLAKLGTHVAAARTEDAVKLHGTRGAACFYATTDATTGQPNGYHFWLARSGGRNGELQIRVQRDLAKDDDLFFKAKLKSLTPTSVEVDAKDAMVYAQHQETGYHGEPEGPNAWIGSAKVTATVAP